MNTFVVRIFGPDPGQAELRGTVDEVSSGFTATFHDARELVRILSRRGGPSQHEAVENDE
jgi:hypothetical protein